MPGASDSTRRVDVVNANWTAGEDGSDGVFQLLLVTEDGQRHVVTPSPAAVSALLALAAADTVLLWDAAGPTLIATNIVGQWLAADWSATS